jgi:hypothetical protein
MRWWDVLGLLFILFVVVAPLVIVLLLGITNDSNDV